MRKSKSASNSDNDEQRFNNTLKQMLKTPPDPKTGKGKPVAPDGSKDSEGVPRDC